MARKIKTLIGEDGIDRREVGYYSTPDFVAQYITEEMLALNPNGNRVLDPATGKEELLPYFYNAGKEIDSFDIIDYGNHIYSQFQCADFIEFYISRLQCLPMECQEYEYMIANPPYNCHEVAYIKDNKKRIDVHLMVEDVERYVNIYKNIHPEYITFHYEISDSIHRIINIIKGNNIKVGLAIKPNTDISALLSYMDKLDLILVMSVEPGKGGQKYLLKSIDKINELYEIRKKYRYNFKIEVDGGINNETISNVQKADMVVVGSYITNSSNYEERINTIMER